MSEEKTHVCRTFCPSLGGMAIRGCSPAIAAYHPRGAGETCRPRQRGFTLVELIVAVAIMAILVTLVVGVSKHVRAEAARKATASTQAILMDAIQEYFEQKGGYPPQSSMAELVEELKAQPEARTRLYLLPQDAFKTTTGEVVDGFGNAMSYSETGGLGGGPVVISSGPDGPQGTSEDNIRSDGR